MCWTASLFLLQRLKGSMSGDARDFNNIETRAVIMLFPHLQGKAPKEIHAILKETLGEHEPSYATVKNWVAKFKRGDFSTCDAPRPGRPKTVTTLEIIVQIHEITLEDGRISAKSITEKLGISRELFGFIIYEDLDMRKLSAKWVPKCLNADQKCQRCQSSEQLLEFFRCDPNDFLSGLLTMDETFHCLDHPPYSPDPAPSNYHLFHGLKKTIGKSPSFFRRGGHCCRGDLFSRTNFWIFLSDFKNLELRAKKLIELCGECAE